MGLWNLQTELLSFPSPHSLIVSVSVLWERDAKTLIVPEIYWGITYVKDTRGGD